MTAPSYAITLSLPEPTVTALIDGGYSLCVMLSARIQNAAARPTVAGVMREVAPVMTVEWAPGIFAYTSSSPIVDGGVIKPGFIVPITVFETLSVMAGGVGRVMSGGDASNVTIVNETEHAFTSGLAATLAGEEAVPLFAVPLYGQQANVAAPLLHCLLIFTTRTFQPGTVLDSFTSAFPDGGSCSRAILVTATGGEVRPLEFDIDAGWQWGRYAWAELVARDADLASVLIEQG